MTVRPGNTRGLATLCGDVDSDSPPKQSINLIGGISVRSVIISTTRLAIFLAVVLGSVLIPLGYTEAVAAQSSNHGLASGTPTPTWAAGRPIHFFQALNQSPPTRAGSGTSKGAHNELGRRCEPGYCPTPPLLYDGGPVQLAAEVHLIFWGSNWQSTGASARQQVETLFGGFSGSAYQGILTQYSDASGYVASGISLPLPYSDGGVAAPASVNDAAIRNEVAHAIAVTGWARTANSQFVVLVAPGATYAPGFDTGFCAYHGVDGAGSSYTFDPYIGDEPFLAGCSGYDPQRNVNNVTSMLASHEYAESVTDPNTFSGWRTSDGFEIGDICASGDDQLPDGAYAQGLWDNYENACSLADTTRFPPEAVTTKPSDVQPQLAKLNGTVNPRGYDAKYYFQYGLTTSYGSTTSEGDAGAGQSPVAESATITGLVPGHIYHYRIVGTSGGVTSYGSDRAVATISGSNTTAYYSPAEEGLTDFVVEKADNKVHQALWTSGGGWKESAAVSIEVATGTNPSAFYEPAGEGPTAFFVGKADNKLHQSLWTAGTGWIESAGLTAEAATGTNPSAFYEVGAKGLAAFYVRKSDSKIHEGLWTSGSGWTESGGLTAEVAAGTNPSAFYEPAGAGPTVFYVRKSDDKLHQALWTAGTGWIESGGLTAEVATGTTPSAFYETGAKGPAVFYVRKSDGKIHEALWTSGSGWTESGAVTAEAATGTNPSAFYSPGGEGPTVFYVRKSDNKIHQALWTASSGWVESAALSAEVATGATPSAFYYPGGEGFNVFFVSKADHKTHEISWTGSSGWTETGAVSLEAR
jgi:hypothetical protein